MGSGPKKRPRIIDQWLIRAGLGCLAGGFGVALVCAVILANHIAALEAMASTFHHLSKMVLLLGLILVLAGYRDWRLNTSGSFRDRSPHYSFQDSTVDRMDDE